MVAGTSIRARLASGGGQEEILLETNPSAPATFLSPQLSPDDRYLVYTMPSGPTGIGVWAMPLAGEKKALPVIPAPSGPARIVKYRLSPDGRWLTYSSTESGREEVYVTHFPSGEGKWQVSQSGGTFPTWRGDSKEIWYIGLDNLMLHAASVSVKNGEFGLDSVKPLFQITYTTPLGTPYDLSPDGKRAILCTFPESLPTPLVLVTNWMGELKK